jgi:hypothetical protein
MLYDKIIRNYKPLILAMIALTLLLLPFARKSTIDNNIEENVLHDEKLSNYKDFLKTFGNDRLLIAAFKYETIDAELIRDLYDLEDRLLKLPSVERVISPVSILKQSFGLNDRDSLEIWLKSPARLANYVSKIYKFTSVSKTILSPEKKTASLIVRLGQHISDTDVKCVDEIIRVIESDKNLGPRVKVSGIPAIVKVIHGYTARDQKLFTPITIAVILIILFMLYRSGAGVFIPLPVIVLPLLWTQAVYNLNGNSTNFITSMMPPLLLGIALTSAIHIVTAYFEKSRDEKEFNINILTACLKDLAAPVILCQITTVFGFASLGFNGIGAIMHFGVYSALGVFLTIISALFLLPALLAYFKISGMKITGYQTSAAPMNFISRIAARHKYIIVALSLIAGLIGLYGITFLEVETSLIKFLPPSHPEIIKGKFIEENLFGSVPVQIVLKVKPESIDKNATLETGLLNSVYCNKISDFTNEILKIKDINSAVSYVNFIQDYDREFSGEKNNIPPTAPEIKDYLDFYRPYSASDEDEEGDYDYEIIETAGFFTGETREVVVEINKAARPGGKNAGAAESNSAASTAAAAQIQQEDLLDGFITRDYTGANIAVRINDVSSKKLDAIFDEVERLASKHLPENIEFYLTGRAYLWARTSEILAYNEIENFALSLVLIIIVVISYFRSLKAGLISIAPNILPLIMLYGYMGWSGIAFDTVTGMIASVAIGIGFDDTIHYIYEFRKNIKSGLSYEDAAAASMRVKGSSMVFTTVVIACAFGALMTSEFVPTQHFGVLISFNMLMALIFDLFLTPALLLISRPF